MCHSEVLGMERAKQWLSGESFPCGTKPLLLEELECGLSFEVSLLSFLLRAPCTCGLTCFQTTSLHRRLSISSHDCLSGSTHGSGAGAGEPAWRVTVLRRAWCDVPRSPAQAEGLC